jgi:hypothetical protein
MAGVTYMQAGTKAKTRWRRFEVMDGVEQQ